MEKFAEVAILLDIYGGNLTPKQRDVLDLYYNHDLSLSEIAENHQISRQGVYDLIKRGETALRRLDKKMGLYSRWMALEMGLKEVVKDLDSILELTDREWTENIEKTRERLSGIRQKLILLMNSD
mgnify:CR=1 FL=1